MSDYAPPLGPPPPKVPEGWKAVFNDQYKEWFYVNLHTKQSTWEKPTEAAPKPGETKADDLPPYSAGGNGPQVSDTKKSLESNNPYNNGNSNGATTTSPPRGETDEQMARRLQAEYNGQSQGMTTTTMASGDPATRGHADTYYNSQQPVGGPISGIGPGGSPSSPTQQRSSDRGFLSKLKNKLGSGGSSSRPPQQYGYGGYPQQGYGGYPQQPQYYGGYPQQPMYAPQQRPRRGMGAGGAAALGVGGGLVGGMLLADAFDHDDYQDGYQDGMNADGDGGGYDGGGDMGGGDF